MSLNEITYSNLSNLPLAKWRNVICYDLYVDGKIIGASGYVDVTGLTGPAGWYSEAGTYSESGEDVHIFRDKNGRINRITQRQNSLMNDNSTLTLNYFNPSSLIYPQDGVLKSHLFNIRLSMINNTNLQANIAEMEFYVIDDGNGNITVNSNKNWVYRQTSYAKNKPNQDYASGNQYLNFFLTTSNVQNGNIITKCGNIGSNVRVILETEMTLLYPN